MKKITEIHNINNELNNKLSSEYYVNEKYELHGLYKYYGGNKLVASECIYKNNIKYGICKSYFINTYIIHYLYILKNDFEHGISMSFRYHL